MMRRNASWGSAGTVSPLAPVMSSAASIALILGVDRILDMCRTVVNVTGDATVATVVAASEDQLELVPAMAR